MKQRASNWILGTVQWFDELSGEGMILDNNSKISYYVHYSAIISNDERRTLNQGCSVRYRLYENLYSKQVDRVVQINK